MKRYGAFALLILASAAASLAEPVDLMTRAMYARRGFDSAWTSSPPAPGDTNWRVATAPLGRSRLLVREIDFERDGKRPPSGLVPAPAAEATIGIRFDVDEALMREPGLAIHLAGIGEGWQAYLNGTLIRDELIADPGSGRLLAERSIRGAILAFDKKLLKPSANYLVFRVRGDPGGDRFGFYVEGSYRLDSYENVRRMNVEYVELVLIGIYLLFGAYHAMLWFIRRSMWFYLYNAIATLSLGFYMLARSFAVQSVVVDVKPFIAANHLALFLFLPFTFAFWDSIFRGRVSIPVKAYTALSFALGALTATLRTEYLVMIYFSVSAAAFAYAAAFDLILPWTGDMRRNWSESGGRLPARIAASVLRTIYSSTPAKLLLVFLACALVIFRNILRFGINISAFTVQYALLAFVLAEIAILAGRVNGAYRELEFLSRSLRAKVDERTAKLAATTASRKSLNDDLAGATMEIRKAMFIAERDMGIAVSVQRAFFPETAPRFDGWDVALAYEPRSGVSGDAFDFYGKEGRLDGLMIGDVSGNGISSGLITVLARSIFFRSFQAGSGLPLGAMLVDVDRELTREFSSVENTMTCVLLRTRGPKLEYVNAGHADPLFKRPGKTPATVLAPKEGNAFRAPALGRHESDTDLKALSFSMSPGDSLLLYTPFLVEGRNSKDEAFGIDRLLSAFSKADEDTAESVLASVLIDFRNFRTGVPRSDDLTAIVLRKA